MKKDNTIESLRQWFRKCPLLSGEKVGVNFLDESPTNFAVFSSPSTIKYHENVLGEEIPNDEQEFNFSFAATDSYGADIRTNAIVQGFYEAVTLWIIEQNSLKNFPNIPIGKIKSITPTLTAYPSSVGEDSAVFRIQIKMIYRRS